jgi:hypothetical protein
MARISAADTYLMGGTFMIAQLELDAYRHLIAYLCGGDSLRNFRQWFDAATWESAADSDLIGQIELGLAELSSGHRTESELKESFHNFASNLTLEIAPFQEIVMPYITSGANNKLKTTAAAAGAISGNPDSPVGKLLAVGCG